MKIGITQETFTNEHRVALVPANVAKLTKAKHQVFIESDAGLAAGYPDEAYQKVGAEVLKNRAAVFKQAQIILLIRAAGANLDNIKQDAKLLTPEHVVIAHLEPLYQPEGIQALAKTGATFFALELLPRITRAQSMDALSAMSTVIGYKAVILAAQHLGKFFPMFMTAAGTISPARVFILGAGVIGLQAIATAKRLGAVVEAYDIRPVVKEQVESLGAKFIEFDIETSASEDTGGYAKAQSDDFYRQQQALMTAVIAKADVVITTALVPGKKAPILVTKEMVASMRPGSVIVDTAAEKGGNCELTVLDQTIMTDNHVTLIGPGNLPSTLAFHASQMMANNITSFLQLLTNDDGEFQLNREDEIVAETLVAENGAVIHDRVLELID